MHESKSISIITMGGVLILITIVIGIMRGIVNPNVGMSPISKKPSEEFSRKSTHELEVTDDLRIELEKLEKLEKEEIYQKVKIKVLKNKTLAQIFESRIPEEPFDKEAFFQLKKELIRKSSNILGFHERHMFEEIIDNEVNKWRKERQEVPKERQEVPKERQEVPKERQGVKTIESKETSLNEEVNNFNISLKPKFISFVLVPFITGILVTLSASLIKTVVTLIHIFYKLTED